MLSLAERFGQNNPRTGLRLSVALPTTPPFDPIECGDISLSIRGIRESTPPHQRDEVCFGWLQIGVSPWAGAQQKQRTGVEMAAELSRILRTLRLDDPGPGSLTASLVDGGRATLNVAPGSDTLVIPPGAHRMGGRRTKIVQEEALAAGRRVVLAGESPYVPAGLTNREDWGGLRSIEILDPTAPFTLHDVRQLLAMWDGRVYGGSVGTALTAEAYTALRGDLAASGDPFGRWSVSLFSSGVRDAVALAKIEGRSLPREYGVGTVAGPDGEELDVFVSYQGGAWKLVAYARALDTDTAAVFGEVLGDASLIAPRPRKTR